MIKWTWASFWALFGLVILTGPAALIASFFKNQKTRNLIYNPTWPLFTKTVLHISTFTRISKWDRRPKDQRIEGTQGLIITNHSSMIDIALIAEHHIVPPLMKKEVCDIPIFGHIIKVAAPIIVDRKDHKSRVAAFEECTRRLRNGSPVQVYPEGTRSKNGRPKKVSEIHTKLLEFAFEHRIHITPVSIYGTKDVLEKNARLHFGQKVGLITHGLVYPEDYQTVDAFISAAWSKVVEGHEELDKLLSHTN